MKKMKYILISALLLLALTGCGNDKSNNTNQGNNNGTNAVEDMGDGIIDGAQDVGDGIIDGAEEIGDGVKKSMDDMTGINKNRSMK